MARAALVTALYDLSSYQRTERPRPIAAYLELAAPLLAAPYPLVLITEPALAGPLLALRNPSADTHICVKTLEELCPLDGPRAQFAERFYMRSPAINVRKDTPAYMALQHAKFDILIEAKRRHAIAADVLVWIDAGILHVDPARATDNLERLSTVLDTAPTDRAVFGVAFRDYAPPSDSERYQCFHGRVSGGLFSLPARDVETWRSLVRDERERALAGGGYPFECDVVHSLLVDAGHLPRTSRNERSFDSLPPVATYETGENYCELFTNFPSFRT